MQGKYHPLIAGALAIMLAVPAWSAPPEGKGKPEHFKSESGHPGKGKPDHRSGADRSPKFLGHDETSTPDF